jgi:hypothetical protein
MGYSSTYLTSRRPGSMRSCGGISMTFVYAAAMAHFSCRDLSEYRYIRMEESRRLWVDKPRPTHKRSH